MKQSGSPLKTFLSEGWFIKRVLHLSNGDTVHVKKKPAVKAAQN